MKNIEEKILMAEEETKQLQNKRKKLIFRLFMEGKNRNQIAVCLKEKNTNPNLLYEITRQRNSQKQTSQ